MRYVSSRVILRGHRDNDGGLLAPLRLCVKNSEVSRKDAKALRFFASMTASFQNVILESMVAAEELPARIQAIWFFGTGLVRNSGRRVSDQGGKDKAPRPCGHFDHGKV